MSTHQAVRQVEDEVRELIRRSGLDPASDTAEVRRLVQDAVQDYDERSLHGGLPPLGDQRLAVHSILSVVAGYGPLQQYFDDPTVEEIWINEPSKVFVARGGVAELTTTILTAEDVRDLVERMLRTSGRRVDLSSPFVDATLADGSRLHVVIPDISRSHWQNQVKTESVSHFEMARLSQPPRQTTFPQVRGGFGRSEFHPAEWCGWSDPDTVPRSARGRAHCETAPAYAREPVLSQRGGSGLACRGGG